MNFETASLNILANTVLSNTYGINEMRILKPSQILAMVLPIGMYMIPLCGPTGGCLPLHTYNNASLRVNSLKEYNVTVCALDLNVIKISDGIPKLQF